MTVKVPDSDFIETTNDIVIGQGVIPALVQIQPNDEPITYVLPNYRYTQDRELAVIYAKRLDSMIQANMKRKNKRTH